MNKIKAALIASALYIVSTASIAKPIPTELEGIKLGEELNADISTSGIDIKAIAQGALGVGVQLWFKPKKDNPELPYRELDLKPGDEVKTTSHRLYLVPLLPANIESHPDPLSQKWRGFRIHRIEWTDNRGTKTDHYWWAFSTCKALSASLQIKPKVIDNSESNFYSCEFQQDNRVLEAASLAGRSVSLSFSREFTDAELRKVSNLIERARGDRILKGSSK